MSATEALHKRLDTMLNTHPRFQSDQIKVSIGSFADTDAYQVALFEQGLMAKVFAIDGKAIIRRMDMNVNMRGKSYVKTHCLATLALEALTFITPIVIDDVKIIKSLPVLSVPNYFGRGEHGKEQFQFRVQVEYLAP